jgi:hypothetical protein
MNATNMLTLPLRAPFLDRRLIEGADPRADPVLELRAQRVCSRRRRERLASAIEHVLAEAETDAGPPSLSAAAPVAHESVMAARTALLDLARRLRAPAPVDPQGVLLVRRLLSDPAGPLATPSSEGSLEQAVRHARAALTPRHRAPPRRAQPSSR